GNRGARRRDLSGRLSGRATRGGTETAGPLSAGRGPARGVEIRAGGGAAGGRLMSETKTHAGSCHCGAVAYEVETGLDGLAECNCSHCLRKGFVLAFAPRSAFRLTRDGPTTEYKFHAHKIAHQFCPTCGVQPFAYGTMPDGSETV